MTLAPTELNRLHTEGSVRIVRKCEPQPTVFANDGWPMEYGVISPESVNIKPIRTPSPFPPAGHRETIDGVDCVWGKVECKQYSDFTKDEIREAGWEGRTWVDALLSGDFTDFEVLTSQNQHLFTTTIRKDTE